MIDTDCDKRKLRSQKTRLNIIQAALHCYETVGIEKTTMEVVAKQAGIGRATLYRHFNNQDEILAEAVMLEMQDIQAELEVLLKDINQLETFMISACLLMFRECPKHTVASQMFGSESGSAIVQKAALSQALLSGFGEYILSGFYEQAKLQGRLRDGVELSHMVEWVTRFLTSYLSNPSPLFDTEEQQRFLVLNALLPSLIVVD